MTERQLPDWNRVDKVIGKEGRESLQEKRVVVVGLGSLGSEVTRLLSMCGVGKFTLIDPDIIEPSNVVRHAAGLTDLGRDKVAAVRDIITKQRNPDADVWAVRTSAEFQIPLLCTGDIAIISGLGSNIRQSQIASILRYAGVPVVVGGVYEKGVGGEVYYVDPEEGPCYSCFNTYLGKAVEAETVLERRNLYGMAPDQIDGVPALVMDINRIATITAEFALKKLMQETSRLDKRVNLVIFSNTERLTISKDKHLSKYQSQWIAVPKLNGCLVCSDISLSRDVSNLVNNFFSAKGGEEDE